MSSPNEPVSLDLAHTNIVSPLIGGFTLAEMPVNTISVKTSGAYNLNVTVNIVNSSSFTLNISTSGLTQVYEIGVYVLFIDQTLL